MPNPTFFNLPGEKRERIIRAGIDEYSRVPLEEVSIKNIVNDAGIPRGSFYQYFEDKEDLLCFLIETVKARRDFVMPENTDPFEFVQIIARREISSLEETSSDSPDRIRLFNQISQSPRGSVLFFEQINRNMGGDEQFVRTLAKSGLNRLPEVRYKAVMELLFAAVKECMLSVVERREEAEPALTLLKTKAEIIKAGI